MNPWTDLPKNSIGKLGRITGIFLAIDLVGRSFQTKVGLQSLLFYQFSVPSICATAKYFMRN